MERLHQLFLETLGAFLRGASLQWEDVSEAEWDALLSLSQEHHVLPMVYEAVRQCPAFSRANRNRTAQLQQQIRQTVARQMAATEEFLRLYLALCNAGANPLVVKGIVCRSLYPMPDWRRSGDEDVLIDPKEYWLCKRVLGDFGLLPEDCPEDAYEIPFSREDGPLYIELHRSLFPGDSQAYGHFNALFDGAMDRAVTVTVQGQPIRTLCPTDHLLYLLCHAYKHFLHSGFGIRQVCDMALFANRYGRQIDWEWILDRCRSIRAEKFAAALFAICREYLTLDYDAAGYPACWREIAADPGPLLAELLQSGIYGQTDPARLHSGNITLDSVAAQKQGRRAKNGLAASLFPPAKRLRGRYPYLQRHPWLLPVAWASRILRYGGRSREEDGSNAARILRMGSHRLDLLRLYGIID